MTSLLSGASLSPDAFTVEHTDGLLPSESLSRLLDDELAALYVHNALSASECNTITNRFWDSPGRTPRPDGVSGFYLGAYHYGKTFEAYSRQARESAPHVDALFDGVTDPVDLVMASVRRVAAGRNLEVRPASWRGHPAARARALSWTAEGPYLLAPHDDVGQLTNPDQSDFEIQRVAKYQVLAVNVYPRVPKSGGNLRVWNIQPNDSCRQTLGIEHTGYPYPEQSLAGYPFVDIEVETGAIVVANGGLVHAVTGYPEPIAVGSERLGINFFFGQIDSKTIVHWV